MGSYRNIKCDVCGQIADRDWEYCPRCGVKLDKSKAPMITEVYERITTGLGDGIMIRPAILANMREHPERRHVAHIFAATAAILEDIEGIELVPIHTPPDTEEDEHTVARFNVSRTIAETYAPYRIHNLSNPCSAYETLNAPWRKVPSNRRKCRFSRTHPYIPLKSYRIPRLQFTNERVVLRERTGLAVLSSRQEIFCRECDVKFDTDYGVSFSEEEEEFAEDFLEGMDNPVGIHLRSSERWRDYERMDMLVEYAARKHKGTIVTIDREGAYYGRRSNVASLLHDNVRYVWAVISRLKRLIGPDSFGVHAAGSTGVETYGIFGPTDPAVRLKYRQAAWCDKWNTRILRRGLKPGCGYQYCWYTACEKRDCINSRLPGFYWNDSIAKLGEVR